MKKLLIVIVVLMMAVPAMADPVATEMVEMNLTGPNPFGGADITVTMDPVRNTYGRIADDTNFPAESFFDVYIEVDIPGYGTFRLQGSETAVHMLTDILSIPPAPNKPYYNQGDVEKMLADPNDPMFAVGVILEVVHFTGGLTDSLVLPNGKTREYFADSEAQIKVQLDAFGPDTLTIDVSGTYVIDRGPVPRVPSINAYGILILTLLLLTTGVYVYYRRRRGIV